MRIGYARVSTNMQDLDIQIQELKNVKCDLIFQEKISGAKKDRPEFNKALETLKKGDTFIVTRLDRFARSLTHSLKIISDLFEKGISIQVLNIGIIEDSSSGRLIFTIFSAFAEFENELRRERIIEGKKNKKLNDKNFKDGRPQKYPNEILDMALELKKDFTWSEIERKLGISQSTLYRYQNKKRLEKYEKDKNISKT